jgi:hypothetical protein
MRIDIICVSEVDTTKLSTAALVYLFSEYAGMYRLDEVILCDTNMAQVMTKTQRNTLITWGRRTMKRASWSLSGPAETSLGTLEQQTSEFHPISNVKHSTTTVINNKAIQCPFVLSPKGMVSILSHPVITSSSLPS